jgi:rubrerythrin
MAVAFLKKGISFMHTLPSNAPANLYEAFTYIGSVVSPSLDDLRLMVILEAAGKAMYDDLASGNLERDVQSMLKASGRDELKHAVRVSEAIGKLTGTKYPVPVQEENPYLSGWAKPQLTAELVDDLAKEEFAGEALYEGWAAHCANPAAAELFRLNGREETSHGHRLQKVAKLLVSR